MRYDQHLGRHAVISETKSFSGIEKEVYTCERERLDAIVRGDVAALSAMATNNAIILHGSGPVEDLKDFLATFGSVEFLSIEQRQLWIRSFGDSTVVVCSVLDVVSRPKAGGDSALRGQNQTTVWCRDIDGWKLNTWHVTRLA
jgi:ketosteroid isomerase-like protein